MSTITLPNIRVSSDLEIRLKLKDGGVAIDWSTLTNIKASIYSDRQRSLAGRCDIAIDEEDSTILVCRYSANKPQYPGVNRVIVSCTYDGETKTYDKPAFTFVRWTDDQAGQSITIDDPDIDVEITVEDISSSILQEAVEAANSAAERANDAAAAAEHMVDIHTGPAGADGADGKSAYELAVEEGYTGTEEEWLASLHGADGTDGTDGTDGKSAYEIAVDEGFVGTEEQWLASLKGEQGNTGSSVDYPYELVNNRTTDDATKGLSAAEGKRLGDDLSQLEAEVSFLDEFYIDDVEEDATSFDLLNFYITDQGKWSTNSAYKHCEIPIEPGTPVRVTASAGERTFVSFLKTNTRTSGGDVDVCSSLVGTWRIELSAGETRTLVAPSDANYFYFYRGWGAQSYPFTPSEIIFILPKIDAEEVNASIEEVVELREDVGNTAFPSVTQDCSNTTWVSGNILAVSGSSMGGTGTSSANSHTDYIELGGVGAYSRVLRYTRGNTTNSSSNAGLVFYDANKDAIDFQKMVVDAPEMGYSMEDLPVPADAKYFRTTIRNEDVPNFSATLTITTKVFTSGLGKEVQDMQEDVDYLMGLAPGQYKPFNVVGSPVPYIPTIDTTGLSVFSNLTTLYDAFDALVTAHPDWFKKEADLGMDASNTYVIRHYSLRFQHPLITNDRAGDGMNLWDDTKYKYRRIIVNMGIHATEKYSVLGGYLAIKAILESNDPWAKFIKDNFVIDVIPSSNPWGLMNNSSQNANGYNLNRTFFENVQTENTAIINLIADLKQKGLVGVIDLHNTGLGDSGGNSYFVSKPTYKFWDYYAVLVQQLQALLYDFTETMFGNDRDNHFHLWDGSENSGQLHQYADSQGLLGGTVEVSSGQGITGSFLTVAQVVNIINAFGTFTNV